MTSNVKSFSDAGFCCMTTTPLSKIWRRAEFYFTPRAQGHWHINKRHLQVVKLTNGARQVCFFYIPITRGVGFILTPDSAVLQHH
jgi:hypothetical protein